jgi:RND family efflux transporter MFP subunit
MKRALAAILPAAALFAACHKGPAEDVATTAPVPVQVAEAHLGTITSYVRVTGTVDPAPGADWVVVAPQQARIAEIRYATGDVVRQGSVVARFDAPPLRSDLATRSSEASQAQARLDNARRNYNRLSTLLEKGIASRKEVEDARKELLDGESAVRESGQTRAAAAILAARATPIAPFSGLVAERWHNPGDVIDANEHVLRVVDPRRLQVTAAVPVADAPRVIVGHAARVTIPGSQAAELTGRVTGAPAAVDPVTGTAAVRVAIVGTLPVGTPVELAIVAEERANALLVPAAAIVREENKTTVFVVAADMKAHRRAVVVGLVSADEAQLSSGVREGEKVVVKGQDELPDGATVTIEDTGEEKEAAPAAAGKGEEKAAATPTAAGASAAPASAPRAAASGAPATAASGAPAAAPPASTTRPPASATSPLRPARGAASAPPTGTALPPGGTRALPPPPAGAPSPQPPVGRSGTRPPAANASPGAR